MNLRETAAVTSTIGGLILALGAPFAYQHARLAGPPGTRTIVLTGVAPDGVWTEDRVTGANYWKGGFAPARLAVKPGETVRLVLRSADVTHRFYMPTLGIGPLELMPGHTEEVTFTAGKAGVIPYYCTTLCIGNMCHYYMRGGVAVGDGAVSAEAPGPEGLCLSHAAPPPPPDANIVDRGRYVFATKGCVTCHGQEGRGGIVNFNYAKKTVPRLNTLAEKMFLASKADVDAFVAMLSRGEDPVEAAKAPRIANWALVRAQYAAVTQTIRQGSVPERARKDLPAPPLFMPRWSEALDGRQIDSVIAYLVSEEKFEEQKGWGE